MKDNWTVLECEAIVQDYFDMLMSELRDEPYNKSAHRRALSEKLSSRSDTSIEYKHRNIGAILNELDRPYIEGYKPAYNYQKLLRQVVLNRLEYSNQAMESAVDKIVQPGLNSFQIADWDSVLVAPPEFGAHKKEPTNHVVEPRGKYSVSTKEQANKVLGRKGEEFVLSIEKRRLSNAGREDLAKEVEWTSEVRGDGAGYDVRSFDARSDKELYIEVKTTGFGKYTQFFISPNEVKFSQVRAAQYALYRVFNFRKTPKLFLLEGDITNHTHLAATNYRATFS
jgi:hypothetical protein